MKKTLLFLFSVMALCASASAQTALNTKSTTLVINAHDGSRPDIVYYGSRISADDVASLSAAGYRPRPAYPAFGLKGEETPVICITEADGNKTLDLRIVSAEETSWEGGKELRITSKDSYYPVTVTNVYKTFEDQDMIETWAEITNEGKKEIILTRYLSGALPFRSTNAWTSTLYGEWGNEARICEEPVTPGYKVIKNTDGVRNAATSRDEMMISLDGKPRENEGRVIGVALEWGGNFELAVRRWNNDYCCFYGGICPDNAEYYLGKGESLKTPALAYSFSDEGLGGVSRNFHRWGRKYRLQHGDVERDILLNSWEGVYLDVNEPAMAEMMKDIATLGGELFVMDDGWFGGKYARKTDDRGLGDWFADTDKLPHGLSWLTDKAKENGIKFGIWIEPEMCNTKSELFEKHPDWVVGAPNRDIVCGRGGTQQVLDMSNPEVQDFVVSIVDDLVKECPGLAYIKWDANMSVNSYGSHYLKHQSHLAVDYWKGFEATCNRIRAKYPDLVIQACASGGARACWGVLPWFDEFWGSDDTDALQRIYIQWGTSYFFPAIATASHISAVPNHQTHRIIPIKFRADVAMTGRLGIELQPSRMSPEEYDFCRKAVATYKTIRPVVQLGDQYRLIAPQDDLGVVSLMYVSEPKDKAVFFWYRLNNLYGTKYPRVQMRGLDPDKKYKVTELNRIDKKPMSCEGQVFSGKFLMESGLEIAPVVHDVDRADKSDWASRVLYLVAE